MAAFPPQINLQQQPVDVGGGFADPMDPCTQCQMGNQELTQAMQQLTQICNACTTQQRLQQQTSGSCTECQAAQQSINQAQMQLNQMGGCSQCGQPMMTTGNQGVAFNPQVMAAGQMTTVTPPTGFTVVPTTGPGQPSLIAGGSTGTVVVPSTGPGQAGIQPAGTAQIVAGPPVAVGAGGGKTPVAIAGPEGFTLQAGGIGPTVGPAMSPAFTFTPTTGGGFVATPAPISAPPVVTAAPPPVVTPTLTPAQVQAAQNVAAGLSTIPTQGVLSVPITGPPGGFSLSGVPSPGLAGGGVGITGAFDSNQWLLKGLQATNMIRNLL